MSHEDSPSGEGRTGQGDDAMAAPPSAGRKDPSGPGLRSLLEKLNKEHNFDFRQYKEASIQRRIRHRMALIGVDSFEAYSVYLDRNPGEHMDLLNNILINVTSFFRDPDAWSALSARVLPALVDRARGARSLRLWCA